MPSRASRNNNPGNIEHGGNAWHGMSAKQTDPRFVQFTEGKWGVRAIARILRTYGRPPRVMRGTGSPIDTLAEIIETWSEEELARLFHERADERWSRRIAKQIVERRETEPVRTGRELGRLVSGAIPRKAWPPKTHPATRTFMALRMEVNQELENLEACLPQAVEWLNPLPRCPHPCAG